MIAPFFFTLPFVKVRYAIALITGTVTLLPACLYN
nr:MAG TPA: hypothetical protein [Caudoviricetes sp.]